MRNYLAGAALLIMVGFSASGCAKAVEPFQDAQRTGVDSGPAETVTMPDGFNNLATKCNHGFRIWTTYHADSPYGSVAAVRDLSCPQDSQK